MATETIPTPEPTTDQKSPWEQLIVSVQDTFSSIQKHLPEKFSGGAIMEKAGEMMRKLNEAITTNKLVKAGALAGALVLAIPSIAQAGETLNGVLSVVDRAQQEQPASVDPSKLPDNIKETLVKTNTLEKITPTDEQMPDGTENYNNQNQPGHGKDGDTTKIGSIIVE